MSAADYELGRSDGIHAARSWMREHGFPTGADVMYHDLVHGVPARAAPLSGPELAARHGFKPHGKDPLTGGVVPPADAADDAIARVFGACPDLPDPEVPDPCAACGSPDHEWPPCDQK